MTVLGTTRQFLSLIDRAVSSAIAFSGSCFVLVRNVEGRSKMRLGSHQSFQHSLKRADMAHPTSYFKSTVAFPQ